MVILREKKKSFNMYFVSIAINMKENVLLFYRLHTFFKLATCTY